MYRKTRAKYLVAIVLVQFLCVCFLYHSNASAAETPPAPEMPAHWKVISDFNVPEGQVKAMSRKLGADLDGVRNTVYDVNGKRVQINVIITPDSSNAENLMIKLRSIKSDDALLRKGLVVYEFVGRNDVLSLIAEGRNYLNTK
jgi:hypothetical protein